MDSEVRGYDQYGQVKDIEAPAACPICRATSTIKTATQTVCMVCGHREVSQ